jgi:hypothetical protein
MRATVQSLQLGGTGKSVALSFEVPAEVLDFLSSGLNRGRQDIPAAGPGK